MTIENPPFRERVAKLGAAVLRPYKGIGARHGADYIEALRGKPWMRISIRSSMEGFLYPCSRTSFT